MLNKLLIIVLLFATETASAKVYKWVDKNGETHYSEKAPAEHKASELTGTPAPALDTSGNPNQSSQIKRELESEIKAQKTNREAEANAQAAQQAEMRRNKCADAKMRLNMYKQQVPIYSMDANNERVYLDDETRAARIRILTDGIAQNCNAQ
jgi:Domain of unknown function (DUF4124)